MAKRKRLDVPDEANFPGLETKSGFPPAPRARMPIAEVAGDVAGRAALEEVAREMTSAEEEGRVVKKLPRTAIRLRHLTRDRMLLDKEEMEALTASIAERGQQTPIEVVALPDGEYGLISGLRRMKALEELGAETVLALVRKPESSQDAYRAMVEENEMRADLSFYERANIVAEAASQGVFEDERKATKALFAHAPRAKRSKIMKFVTLRDKLGPFLQFPATIPEHLGLKLVQAFEEDGALHMRIGEQLLLKVPGDPDAERRILERGLKEVVPAIPKPWRGEIAPGVRLEGQAGRVVLSGPAVDNDFLAALCAWAAEKDG